MRNGETGDGKHRGESDRGRCRKVELGMRPPARRGLRPGGKGEVKKGELGEPEGGIGNAECGKRAES
jgi:hypothetical protein